MKKSTEPKEVQQLQETVEFKNGLYKQWLEKSPKTEKELFKFIHELTTEYSNDYGTTVYMGTALLKAVMDYYASKEGMTGFQASCMMWQVIQDVFYFRDDIGMKILKVSDVLFPQYDERFEKYAIEPKQHEVLIDLAKKLLADNADKDVHPTVRTRWEFIASGMLPGFMTVVEPPQEPQEQVIE